MFGFFDKQKRREKAALRRFGRKMEKVEEFRDLLRIEKQKLIVKRSETLRAAGNEEEAAKEIKQFLREDFRAWNKKRDPRDLHFIAETLRLGRMAEECSDLLEDVIRQSDTQPIDLTWAYTDLGLSFHQQGRDYFKILECFDKALAFNAPHDVSVAADDRVRARAAFCAFVTSSAHEREKEASYYYERLTVLDPTWDWDRESTLKNYRKSFIGFISIESITYVSQSSDEVSSQKEPVLQAPKLRYPEEGKLVFHRVLFSPKVADISFDSIRVGAEAKVSEADGKLKYDLEIFKGADTFSIIEGQAAINWRRYFDEGKATVDQAVIWLQEFERESDFRYMHRHDEDGERVTELVLFTALTMVSLHYAIVSFKSLGYPEATMKWYATSLARGKNWVRFQLVKHAFSVKEVFEGARIDKRFLELIADSVSRKL